MATNRDNAIAYLKATKAPLTAYNINSVASFMAGNPSGAADMLREAGVNTTDSAASRSADISSNIDKTIARSMPGKKNALPKPPKARPEAPQQLGYTPEELNRLRSQQGDGTVQEPDASYIREGVKTNSNGVSSQHISEESGEPPGTHPSENENAEPEHQGDATEQDTQRSQSTGPDNTGSGVSPLLAALAALAAGGAGVLARGRSLRNAGRSGANIAGRVEPAPIRGPGESNAPAASVATGEPSSASMRSETFLPTGKPAIPPSIMQRGQFDPAMRAAMMGEGDPGAASNVKELLDAMMRRKVHEAYQAHQRLENAPAGLDMEY